MMIQIKLTGMSVISYSTKLHMSQCSGQCIVSIRQSINFNFEPPSMFFFSFITKMVLSRVVHSLKVYENTKFYGPMLTVASFAFISDVQTSVILV
jgi:hypothetical protein